MSEIQATFPQYQSISIVPIVVSTHLPMIGGQVLVLQGLHRREYMVANVAIRHKHTFLYRGYSKLRTRTARRKVLVDLPQGPRTVCVLNSEYPL